MTENEYDQTKLEDVLRKVRGLLATADHPNTPPEMSETYRTQAEALMFKYRLEEARTSGYSETQTMKPVWRTIALGDYGSEFANYYRDLGATVRHHVSVRGITTRERNLSGNYELIMKAVGYESDLRYMDVLLTSALLEFSKRLEPTYDTRLTIAENIYNMRHAGMERKRIARIVYGDWTTENEMKAKNRKVTTTFKTECYRRGEDPMVLLGRGNNMGTYRESYAQGFVDQFYNRLLRMRQAHGEEAKSLVLKSRREEVDEAFYQVYPSFRPKPVEPEDPNKVVVPPKPVKARKIKERPFNYAAYGRGEDAARAVDLGHNATGTGRMQGDKRGEIE